MHCAVFGQGDELICLQRVIVFKGELNQNADPPFVAITLNVTDELTHGASRLSEAAPQWGNGRVLA